MCWYITIPGPREEGGTSVIPGHEHLYNEADVADYRDMLVVIRDRIQNAIRNGKSPEQVKADRLTRDYDAYYGSNTGNWTTEMFVTGFRSARWVNWVTRIGARR